MCCHLPAACRPQGPSKLEVLHARYNLPGAAGAHRARDDVKVLAAVLPCLLKETLDAESTLEEVRGADTPYVTVLGHWR